MLHIPLQSEDGIFYLSVSLSYRLWTKELSKLELTSDMVRSVMPELASCGQVILLCDSWYPKKRQYSFFISNGLHAKIYWFLPVFTGIS